MGLRRHRQIVVWSSSPGRPGALGFTWAPRSARIRWCFRTGGLLAVIGLLRVEFTPLEITEESLAFGAHEEVGHGGHFLGAAHTMERFRTCFYRPMLSSTSNFERWLKQGGKDTAARAGDIWRKQLSEFTPPPLDDAIRAELDDYVTRRRRELGD